VFFVAMVEHHPLTRLATSAGRSATNVATRTIRVVRSDDQLDVVVELFDVEIAGDQLHAAGPNPHLRLTFGAQHTAEELLAADDPVPSTPLQPLTAGASVVVTPVVADAPFTLAGILDLAAAALIGQATAGPPDGSVTAVEVPAGLVLSPTSGARLEATATPVTSAGTTEVWTARLVAEGSGPRARPPSPTRDRHDALPPNAIPTEGDRGHRHQLHGHRPPRPPAVAVVVGARASTASGTCRRDRHDHHVTTGRAAWEVVSTGYLPRSVSAAITEVAERPWCSTPAAPIPPWSGCHSTSP
jgi:hypothetical protein